MSGIDGFGTTLARGNGAGPEVFAVIAGLSSISAPGISRETLDVTAHDSPNGYREFLGGIKDPGEVSVDINYNPVVHDVFVNDLDDINPRSYKITFPEGSVWSFKAFLTMFEPSAPFDDKLSASATFKVTGKPGITAGAGGGAPTITSLDPSNAAVAGGTLVIIIGTNFGAATAVTVDGVAVPVADWESVSANKIALKAPAKTAGARAVTVTNAAGTSASASLTYA